MIRSSVVLSLLLCCVVNVAASADPNDAIKSAFLTGRIDEAKTLAENRLRSESGDSVARAIYAQSLMRTGQYAKAENILTAIPVDHDLILIASLGDLLDRQGKSDEAQQIRRKAIEILNSGKDFSVDELVAGSAALRGIGEYKAANQCIQLAQDKSAEDPFVQLEKIRLYMATHAHAIAAETAKRLTAAHPDCAMAYAEWADALWLARQNQEAVSQLCGMALDRDSTLADARYRLAYYYVLGDDAATARILIEDSLRMNPSDRKNLLLRHAIDSLRFDGANQNPKTNDPELNLVLAELLAAKGQHRLSLVRARAALTALPNDPRGLRQAGMACFRMGLLDESKAILEKAIARDRYDLEVVNLLTFLDTTLASEKTTTGPMTIAFDKRDALVATYASVFAEHAYAAELHRYNVAAAPSLRVQICPTRDDLAVATQGIPFGCCADPADPATSGVVSFENAVFLWSPTVSGGQAYSYRWDAAVHRAVAQAAVRAATQNRAPQWLREGFAGYTVARNLHEYVPPNLVLTLQKLSSSDFALSKLEEGFLSAGRPLFEIYAALLAEEWTARFGDEKINALWQRLASGEPWTEALVSVFSMPLDTLKTESDAAILKRYAWALPKEESAQSVALAQTAIEQGDATAAANHAIDALNAAPLDAKHLGLYRRITETLRAVVPKPEAYFLLTAKLCMLDPANADLRFELAEHFHERNQSKYAVEYCRDALGIRPGWLEAHRLLAQLTLDTKDFEGAYASLVVLHTARPKHVKTLEELILCAETLNKGKAALYTKKLQELRSTTAVQADDSADLSTQQPAEGS